MSREQFDDDCKGCRPVMIDLKTGKAAAPDSVIMRAVNQAWDQMTSMEEREAFHRACCLNSTAPEDLKAVQVLADRIKAAAEAASN